MKIKVIVTLTIDDDCGKFITLDKCIQFNGARFNIYCDELKRKVSVNRYLLYKKGLMTFEQYSNPNRWHVVVKNKSPFDLRVKNLEIKEVIDRHIENSNRDFRILKECSTILESLKEVRA